MRALIFGRGAMGRGLATALEARGDTVVAMLGRPEAAGGSANARQQPEAMAMRPEPRTLRPVDIAFEFSHASSVVANVELALAAGCRAIVVGTSGWTADLPRVQSLVDAAGASLVRAPTFSLAAILFGRLAEEAARLFGPYAAYDPYILEWHRRDKPDRPSGTALALAERILPLLPSKRRARLADGSGAPDPTTLEVVALRAGGNPGMHVLGFDAPGESVEIRVTARDRSAYVAGALLAADRLLADPARLRGVHLFEELIDQTGTTADPILSTPAVPTTAHRSTSTTTHQEASHVSPA